MKIYIAKIDKREETSEILSIHKTRQGAIEAIEAAVLARYNWKAGNVDELLHTYGGDLNKGEFNSEDENYYTLEMELND